jgi:hypothetical protein
VDEILIEIFFNHIGLAIHIEMILQTQHAQDFESLPGF